MAAIKPWKHKKSELAGNGGDFSRLRDFPHMLRRMQHEFEDLLAKFSREMPLATNGNGWHWGVDMEETPDAIEIRAEAPGFEAGDFDIQVSGNRLTLRASHKTETKGKKGETRETHECYESMTLPSGIDTDRIEARYHSGVLTLTIPKSADFKSKKIAVKAN